MDTKERPPIKLEERTCGYCGSHIRNVSVGHPDYNIFFCSLTHFQQFLRLQQAQLGDD